MRYWIGENFYIKITCLPEIFKNSDNITASLVIKELSPYSPNVDKIGTQHKSITNKQIKLADCEVTALVYEYKTDSRNSVVFVYEDMLVEVKCDQSVWNAEWFSSLSFKGSDE